MSAGKECGYAGEVCGSSGKERDSAGKSVQEACRAMQRSEHPMIRAAGIELQESEKPMDQPLTVSDLSEGVKAQFEQLARRIVMFGGTRLLAQHGSNKGENRRPEKGATIQ